MQVLSAVAQSSDTFPFLHSCLYGCLVDAAAYDDLLGIDSPLLEQYLSR